MLTTRTKQQEQKKFEKTQQLIALNAEIKAQRDISELYCMSPQYREDVERRQEKQQSEHERIQHLIASGCCVIMQNEEGHCFEVHIRPKRSPEYFEKERPSCKNILGVDIKLDWKQLDQIMSLEYQRRTYHDHVWVGNEWRKALFVDNVPKRTAVEKMAVYNECRGSSKEMQYHQLTLTLKTSQWLRDDLEKNINGAQCHQECKTMFAAISEAVATKFYEQNKATSVSRVDARDPEFWLKHSYFNFLTRYHNAVDKKHGMYDDKPCPRKCVSPFAGLDDNTDSTPIDMVDVLLVVIATIEQLGTEGYYRLSLRLPIRISEAQAHQLRSNMVEYGLFEWSYLSGADGNDRDRDWALNLH